MVNINSKRTIFIILSVIILFSWFFIANNVVVYFLVDSSNRLTSIPFRKYDNLVGTSIVYTKVDSGMELGDFAERFSIKGGAFCETSVRNPAREIKLILKSDTRAFETAGVSTVRVDLYYDFLATKNISGQGGDIGFQADFSTINLPDDVYELYIYVKENEDTYGYTNTGQKYIKDSNGFYIYDKYGKVISIPENGFEDGHITFWVDTFYVNSDGGIVTNGWGFLRGSQSSETDIYIILYDSQGGNISVELQQELRPDVSDIYGEQYLMSGFRAIMDLECSLEDGIYVAKYLVKNNGRYYISSEIEKIVILDRTVVEKVHMKENSGV